MNVEIGTETPIFLFWKYLFRNFGILSLQCIGGAHIGSRAMLDINFIYGLAISLAFPSEEEGVFYSFK